MKNELLNYRITEDEIITTYSKHSKHCIQNTILPYEYEWSCISRGFIVIKRKTYDGEDF